MENANHTLFMQFHKYRKLHEKSIIGIFSYMETIWLAFFHKPKILIFYIFVSRHFFVVVVLKCSNQRFGRLALKIKKCIGNSLKCFKSVSHKQYNESNELLNFGKNFQRWLVLKFEFLIYQILTKAYKNMSYKRRERSLKRFWKSYEERRKKNLTLVYPGIPYTHKRLNFACFFFQKMFVWVRESVCCWKKNTKKCLGTISKIHWKIFVVAIKKC